MSAEARCPIPKQVEDPMDTSYSIQDVFFNVCGLVEGNIWNMVKVGQNYIPFKPHTLYIPIKASHLHIISLRNTLA